MAGKCLRLLLLVGQTMRERKKNAEKEYLFNANDRSEFLSCLRHIQ